jgi:hypothetical protein
MILKMEVAVRASCDRMHVQMQHAETLNPDQINQFLTLSDSIEFAGQSRADKYAFAQQLLVAQEYAHEARKSAAPSARIWAK